MDTGLLSGTDADSLTVLDIAYGIGLGILQGDQCDLHIDQGALRDLLVHSHDIGQQVTIDVYMGDEYMDVLADGTWEGIFKVKPPVFTREEKRAWLDKMQDVTLGSDAFFPFSDNIERAHKSGVKYIAQPGGSVRDADVIACCDKYNMVMAFTGIRLFHH